MKLSLLHKHLLARNLLRERALRQPKVDPDQHSATNYSDRGANDNDHTKIRFSVRAIRQTRVRSMKDAFFRVGPLVNLSGLVRELGQDPVALFRQAGCDRDVFRDPSHRMNYLAADHLLDTCVAATGHDELGLMLGARTAPSHLGLVGFLLKAAPDARQSLMTLTEHIDLHDEAVVLLLDQEDGYTTIKIAFQVEDLKAINQVIDLSVAIFVKIMLSLCGKAWKPAAVYLERQRPVDLAPYQRFFRAPLYFDAPHSQIVFSDHWLDTCPASADPLLFQHLEQEAMWLRKINRESIIDAIPNLLRKGLLTQRFSAHDIADVFGVNERTLHRRLRAADTTFREELDKVRFAVSCELLMATELPVNEMANALGYSDASGFIRAFRRWSGTSPSHWRQENLAPRPV